MEILLAHLILMFMQSFAVVMTILYLTMIVAIYQSKKAKFDITYKHAIQFAFYLTALYTWWL